MIAQVRKWYPEGVVVREPRYWQDAAFNNLSQPVVGICWYEAMAYANWLATVTGRPYRLPTEPEWEWAARRGGRAFPWGNGALHASGSTWQRSGGRLFMCST